MTRLRWPLPDVSSRSVLPRPEAQRLSREEQVAAEPAKLLARTTLEIDPLTVSEFPLRERYRADFGIGRGEAACLVLARRLGAAAIFLSSDEVACRAAVDLGLPVLTLPDMLLRWVDPLQPTGAELDVLVAGMRAAKFGLTQEFIADLRTRARL
jgi:hypothetical protein